MAYGNLLSMCAAVAITAGGLVVMAPKASAQHRPVVVTAPSNDTVIRRVSYADLNLSTNAGEQLLNKRVGGAVNSVCEEATEFATGSFQAKGARRACSLAAWDGARPQIQRAVDRAREIALTGSSTIAATAIVISIPQ